MVARPMFSQWLASPRKGPARPHRSTMRSFHVRQRRNADVLRTHQPHPRRRYRHRDSRIHGHARPTRRQAHLRSPLSRLRRRTRSRVLQLPPRRRHRQQHGGRLQDLQLEERLRRHGHEARLGHAAPSPVDRGLRTGHRGPPHDLGRGSRPHPAQCPQEAAHSPRGARLDVHGRDGTRIPDFRRHLP